MKKIPVQLTLVSKDMAKEIERLDRLATEIQKVSGYSLEDLLSMFLAGYTLQAPKQITFDELKMAMRAEASESM